MAISLVSLILALVAVADPLAAMAAEPEKLPLEQVKFFENDVRPLLAARCFKCHAADKQKGGLRLDSRAAMLAGGESGPAIVPSNVEESLLVEAVNYASYEMPPDGQLEAEQIAALTRWIELGAPWPGDQGSVPAPFGPKEKFTDEDRDYWFFQPLKKIEPPVVADGNWSRGEIDRFVYRRLQDEGLQPSPEASRSALIRRATFDLWGIPPTPEQVEHFVTDESPRSYENLIERLLESPRYGERWARHWLDLVRYADSNGYKSDEYRPHAWRYRDWVIRALNDDMPYDEFVRQQLAGDEIAPDDPDVVVATGFLRHGSYESNQVNVRGQWADILNDITDVTADVFLGLGYGCARCHDHKFDPILQKDYYRLQAFFTPLLMPTDYQLATSTQQEQMAKWEEMTEPIRAKLRELERPHRRSAGRERVDRFPPDIQAMLYTPRDERTPHEHQLAELAYRQVEPKELEYDKRIKGEERKRWEALRGELAKFDPYKPQDMPVGFVVTDVGWLAPPTHIPDKRDPEDVEPGVPSILDGKPLPIEPVLAAPNSTGRRTALAKWLTRPDHQLTTRVMVNRIWQYHFGRGLVATASDFGRLGEPPSHPELLDWLATEFVDRGWSLKAMHRLIMTSAAYRQAAVIDPPPGAMNKDPENRLLWRANVRRLDAEQIRDAALAASGELSFSLGGPGVDPAKSTRRSIYAKILRNTRDPLLDAFDAPDAFFSASERNTTTTATQALLMINGEWTLKRAKALAGRLHKEAGGDAEAIVQAAYRLAFTRKPADEELAAAKAFLTKQQAQANKPQEKKPIERGEEMPGSRSRNRKSLAARLSESGNQDRLVATRKDVLPDGEFTIEAFILLRSLDKGARVRVIASQWDGSPASRGWSFGVTSEKSRYQPRNLILQLVGDRADGELKYEVIASDLRPELNKPYYAAAVVRFPDEGEPHVEFYLQELTGDASLKMVTVKHEVAGNYRSDAQLVLGNRDGQTGHGWDGLLDDVRLTKGALTKDALLITTEETSPSDVVGWWRFEADNFFADASSAKNDLRPGKKPDEVTDASLAALADFCHVLLNSNEFIYVD